MHLICTGALTNIALLVMLFPEVAGMLQQIAIMGGCMGIGNTHPVAEFNFQASFLQASRVATACGSSSFICLHTWLLPQLDV